jgi:hypothetical protein
MEWIERLGMRWIIAAGLAGLLIGFCGGVALGLSVGRSDSRAASAAPFAPEMSVARFIQCSAVEAREVRIGSGSFAKYQKGAAEIGALPSND